MKTVLSCLIAGLLLLCIAPLAQAQKVNDVAKATTGGNILYIGNEEWIITPTFLSGHVASGSWLLPWRTRWTPISPVADTSRVKKDSTQKSTTGQRTRRFDTILEADEVPVEREINVDVDVDTAQTRHTDSLTVKPGDTLWDLATKYLGDPLRWNEFQGENFPTLRENSTIFPGQRLAIPRHSSWKVTVADSMSLLVANRIMQYEGRVSNYYFYVGLGIVNDSIKIDFSGMQVPRPDTDEWTRTTFSGTKDPRIVHSSERGYFLRRYLNGVLVYGINNPLEEVPVLHPVGLPEWVEKIISQ